MFRRVVLTVFFFVCSASYASAQVLGVPGMGASLFIDMTPSYPGPLETVQLSLRSPLLKLEGASILWYRDGKAIPSTQNATTISILSGELGSTASIVAQITSVDGIDAQAEIIISPTQIDLLYAAHTYVPPFYRGRALPTSGVQVALHALPWFKKRDGSYIATKDINFTWRRGDEIIGAVSGMGKNTATIPLTPFSSENVFSVEAVSRDGAFSNRTEVRVPTTEPLVRLYEHHPLFGILFNQALQTRVDSADTQITVHASPYFAPIDASQFNNLRFDWRADSVPVPDAATADEITIRPTSAMTPVSLDISHTSNIFYGTSGKWNFWLSRKGAANATTNVFSPSE